MHTSRVAVTIAAAAVGTLAFGLVSIRRHYTREVVNESLNGRLLLYETVSRTLTLRTPGGDRDVLVPDGTPLHEGAQTIPLSDLTSARGCATKVWYRDTEGQLVASEVRISCRQMAPSETPQEIQ